MNRIICSTGCLLGRPNGRDFYLLKDLVPRLRCDGLELLMYDTWYGREKELYSAAKELDKPVLVWYNKACFVIRGFVRRTRDTL